LKISRRDRNIIIVGGIVAAVVLVVKFGIFSLIDLSDELASAKQEQEAKLIRMAETIRQREYYQQALSKVKSTEDSLKTVLLEGDDPAAVTAELHRIITTLAEQNSITLARIDASAKPEKLDAETIKKNPFMAGFLKVKVRASLKCTPDKLMTMLSIIENHQKYLIVERLEIRAWNVRPDKEITPDVVLATYLFKPVIAVAEMKKQAEREKGKEKA